MAPAASSRRTTLWAAVIVLFYLGAVVPLHGVVGARVFVLAFAAVILVAYLRGAYWSVLAALVVHAQQFALLVMGEGKPFAEAGAVSAIAGAVSVVVGVAVGHLRELVQRLRLETQEREKAEEAARFLAYHDPVTGLPNRVLLMDRLRLEIAHARRDGRKLAVAFLDIDNFKAVNDTMGHSVGDEVLEKAAVELRGYLRKSDTIARFGADEFALLLPGMRGAEDIGNVASKVLRMQDRAIEVGGQRVLLSFCMGVAVFPDDGQDPETLLRNADIAVGRAKSHGRGRVSIFDPTMNYNASRRMELESDLRHVISRGELSVHYQPQLDCETGRVVGVEALARWAHPVKGNVPPGLFIPVAEDTGIIEEIGHWVLDNACRQVKAWQQAGNPGLRLAVNLSPVQLRKADTVDKIASTLEQVGFDPALLELEITEAVLMQGDAQARESLARLRGLGVKLAIDDFGTGYSSLAYLKRFRVDALKIDRSFVMDLGADEHSEAIVRAIMAIAGALTLRVTAEGVETEEQWHVLRAMGKLGVLEVQGYYFSRPLPPEQAGEVISKPSLTPLPATSPPAAESSATTSSALVGP